jgi:hypothetical protein
MLLLEVWDDEFDEHGAHSHALIYAGPLGDQARGMLSPQARLRSTLLASSHFEAMTAYYRLMGWGKYTTHESWDYEPYPADWVQQQRQAGIELPAV